MVIGGQAVLVYGRPRLTRDIDITLGIDTNDFRRVEEVCRDLRLRLLPEKPEEFAIETKVLPAEDTRSRIRVDFVFSFSDYERQALDRVNSVMIDGYRVRFASCEDLIIHKMVAARAIDEEDVKSVLARNIDRLDLPYVRKWLSEFGEIDEHREVAKRFEDLLETVQRK
jgi:predicted nucleotidyltransferase